jgi:hypothetical protein
MYAGTGWTAASAMAGATASTWEPWCADQGRLLGGAKRQPSRELDSSPFPFSDRALARLSFVRWLSHTGRRDRAQHDHDCEHRSLTPDVRLARHSTSEDLTIRSESDGQGRIVASQR